MLLFIACLALGCLTIITLHENSHKHVSNFFKTGEAMLSEGKLQPRDNICFLGAQGFSTIPKTGAGGCTFLGFGILGPCMYQIRNWVTNLFHETQNWDLVFWDRSNNIDLKILIRSSQSHTVKDGG